MFVQEKKSSFSALIQEQQIYTDYFFENIDQEEMNMALDLVLKCNGILIFCGVGKSGLIAQKIAATFVSIGKKALFLPVADLLHGDIGIISSEDLVFMLSKSGESEELLRLIPYIQARKSSLIAIVSNRTSQLAQKADHMVYLPVKKELCPFDLVPTTSTVAQLLFGDLLAIALMQEKEVNLELYGKNHPLGLIGRKITLRVKDLMKKGEELPLSGPDQKLIDVLFELSNKKCGCLLIVDSSQILLGIFTEGDLHRALQKEGGKILEMPLKDLMCSSPIYLNPDDLVLEATRKMQGVRYVMMAPVLNEEKKVIGLIHMHALIRSVSNQD